MPLTVFGETLGAFCVVDHEPRAWSAQDLKMLSDIAACVTHEIDQRTRLRDVENALRARGLSPSS